MSFPESHHITVNDTHQTFNRQIDGVARCTRYAFGPNRLHLCGPDMNHEVLAYLAAGASDDGLTHILRGFQTLYPYLKSIAHANHIRDPFNARVIEAYWIGNELLDTITPRRYYRYITEIKQFKRTPSTNRSFDTLAEKLRHGATMHHNFHVLNVWQSMERAQKTDTLENMDKCRISWGVVRRIDGPFLTIKRKPLQSLDNKLTLGEAKSIKIIRHLDDTRFGNEIQVGDTLSLHWDIPCEIINKRETHNLKKYTDLAIALANQDFMNLPHNAT